eukprot:1343371-Rhodomonas_salina.2
MPATLCGRAGRWSRSRPALRQDGRSPTRASSLPTNPPPPRPSRPPPLSPLGSSPNPLTYCPGLTAGPPSTVFSREKVQDCQAYARIFPGGAILIKANRLDGVHPTRARSRSHAFRAQSHEHDHHPQSFVSSSWR